MLGFVFYPEFFWENDIFSSSTNSGVREKNSLHVKFEGEI